MDRWASDEPNATFDEDDEEELGGEWELDPNDPTHPDHDLSESAPYAGWDPSPKPILVRRGVILLVSVLVIVGLMIPFIARILL